MGAYKYIQELYREKQFDVLRYFMRIRVWQYRHLTKIHRARRPSRPDKARELGYLPSPGYVIFRIRVRRGGRKQRTPRGVTLGYSKKHGEDYLKPIRDFKAVAEERVGRHCCSLRVWKSYWIAQDSSYKYFEVILVDPSHPDIRNNATINWICQPVHRQRKMSGITSASRSPRGFGRGRHYSQTIRGSRRPPFLKGFERNPLQLHRMRFKTYMNC